MTKRVAKSQLTRDGNYRYFVDGHKAGCSSKLERRIRLIDGFYLPVISCSCGVIVEPFPMYDGDGTLEQAVQVNPYIWRE